METINEIRLWKYGKLSFGLAMFILLYVGTALAQATYTVTDLGTLGGTFGLAYGINNRGWVDGFANLPGDTKQHAFLWQNGRKTDIPGAFGGPNSGAFAGPNERGQVVGQAESATADPNGEDFCGYVTHLVCLPFVWQKGLMSPPLPLLVGGNNGAAFAINERGQAAGQSEIGTPDPTCGPTPPPPFFIFLETQAVIWKKGTVQPLATLPGDTQANALGINDLGQAVGLSGDCFAFQGGLSHAVLWQNGTVTDLGSLGSPNNNLAHDINNLGQAVGFSDLAGDTAQHAFLWQNGVMTDLGALPGDAGSFAPGINNRGQVTGGSFDASGNVRAFLWENGVMKDLNTLIPIDSPLYLLFAPDINDLGEIVGTAFVVSGAQKGEVHAFLAAPTHGSTAGQSATLPSRGGSSERPKITLPENVRKLLQQQLRFGRFGARLTGVQ